MTDHACSVLVGYAASFPHTPRAGTPQEFEVTRTLYRFLAGVVAGLHLGRGRSDCRVLESFVPALRTLGAPSKSFANEVRTRLLVARRRLHIEIRPSSDCPVKLPKAAPS